MQDSILQNGFGESPAPPSTAQVDQVSGFTLSLADKIASQVNANKFSTDFKIAALQGVAPLDHINNLNQKAQEAAQVNQKLGDDINNVKSQIASLKPEQADQSNYQAALGAFQNLANNAPAAPMLQQMNLTDTDKLMMGFALLSGVPANDAIGNFIKVKQGFTDQANQISQRNYANDYNVWNQRLDAAGQAVTNERQAMNDVQQSMDRQYNDQLDSLGQQYTQLMQTGRTQEAQVTKESYQASQMLNNKWKQKGIYTQADYDADVQKAIDAGLDPNQIIFPPIDAPTTQKQGQDFSQGQTTAKVEALKATQTWKNAKELFDMRLKQVNMSGQVTEADRKALLPLAQKLFPESPESLLPQVGEDWRKLQGQQRINKPTGTGSRGGRGRSGGGSPKPLEGSLNPGSDTVPFDPGAPNLTEKEIKSIRSQAYKIDQDIIGLRAEQQATEDKDERKKIESKIAGKRAQREALLKRVGMTADDLKALMGDLNQAMSAFGLSPQQKQSLGIPIEKSYANGGDKTQYGTQNPQAQTKPAKSPQNAGKGQSSNQVTVNGKNLPYKFK